MLTKPRTTPTRVRDLTVEDLTVENEQKYFIVVDGNDAPADIRADRLGRMSDLLIKQFRTKWLQTGQGSNEPILMLAKVGILDKFVPRADLAVCEDMNAKIAEAWGVDPHGKRGEHSGLPFEKYFYCVHIAGTLHGTSALVETYAAANLIIIQALQEKRESDHRRKINAAIENQTFTPEADPGYQIGVARVSVNWPQEIEESRAAYTVRHDPEDFDWDLGDTYDADGFVTGTDTTKKFPRHYRRSPNHNAPTNEEIAAMLETARQEARTKLLADLGAAGRLFEE